jgi:hypothetical protein
MLRIESFGIESIRFANNETQLMGVIVADDGTRTNFVWNAENAASIGCMLIETGLFAMHQDENLRKHEGQSIKFGEALPLLQNTLKKRMELNGFKVTL